MARYFFDLSEDAQVLRDDHGVVCENDRAALRNAWITLAEVVGDPSLFMPTQHAKLSVRRDDGTDVGCVRMTVEVDANAASVSGGG